MIEPNFEILLWFIIISISISSFFRIVAGLTEMYKSNKFTLADTADGVISLIVVLLILLL